VLMTRKLAIDDGGKGMKLEMHTASITGAGRGIGHACAEVLGEGRVDLVLLGKNPDIVSQVVKTISENGFK